MQNQEPKKPTINQYGQWNFGDNLIKRINISITRRDNRAIQRLQESAIFGLLSPAKASKNVHSVVYRGPISIKVYKIMKQTPIDRVDDQPVCFLLFRYQERK